MTIKACSKEDIDLLLRVFLQSYREHYLYLWFDGGESYMRSNFSAERLNEELSDPNAAFFLAYDGDTPVGAIKLNIDKALGSYPAAAALELERIYFTREGLGKGLGKETIDFVEDFARRRNKSIVWLKAMDSSPAVKFYLKRNFRITGEAWLSFDAMKDEYKRMVVMVLDLR
jgi:GNAT superfamily N-acetyltransferase